MTTSFIILHVFYFHVYRLGHQGVHLSNITQVTKKTPLTVQDDEEVVSNYNYESIGFQNRAVVNTRHSSFSYSDCSAYGIDLGEETAVCGRTVNVDESGTDEQDVNSAHETERSNQDEHFGDVIGKNEEFCEDMQGQSESKSTEDDGKNDLYYTIK